MTTWPEEAAYWTDDADGDPVLSVPLPVAWTPVLPVHRTIDDFAAMGPTPPGYMRGVLCWFFPVLDKPDAAGFAWDATRCVDKRWLPWDWTRSGPWRCGNRMGADWVYPYDSGFRCTRRHVHSGRHAHGNGVRIVAAWPSLADPRAWAGLGS